MNDNKHSKISKALLLRYTASLAAVVAGVLLFTLLSWIFLSQFVWQSDSFLYRVFSFIKERIAVAIGGAILLGWAMVSFAYLSKPLRYLDGLVMAAEALAHPSEAEIKLPRELSDVYKRQPFCKTARVMMRFIRAIKDEFGVEIEKLNLGGGFGIKYIAENDPRHPDEFLRQVSAVVNGEAERLGVSRPKMLIEPGRAIVAPAGLTLYTVGGIKEIAGVRTYVSVDGGMPDNPRYALYGSEYTALIANKAAMPADQKVTIAGKCCESGDLLQENTYIQSAAVGDVLAVLATGAYNYSMASNYNRIPRPEMVMVRDGEARTIIRRESYADLVRNDV